MLNNAAHDTQRQYIRYRYGRTAKYFNFPEVTQEFINDPIKYLRSLTYYERTLLNTILYLCSSYETVEVSQTTLGLWSLGLRRQTVNRMLEKFEANGLIKSTYRHMDTCVYNMDPIFLDQKLRKFISPYLPTMSYLPKILVTNPPTQVNFNFSLKKMTQLLKSPDIYINPLSVVSSVSESVKSVDDVNYARARERKNLQLKKENTMNIEQKIAHDILEIAEKLKLTPAGKIKLMGFSSDARYFARSKMKYALRSKDPFAYFMRLCMTYHSDHNTETNWKLVDELKRTFGIAQDAKCTDGSLYTKKMTTSQIFQTDGLKKEQTREYHKAYNTYKAFEHPKYKDEIRGFATNAQPIDGDIKRDPKKELVRFYQARTDGSLDKLAALMGKDAAEKYLMRIILYWQEQLAIELVEKSLNKLTESVDCDNIEESKITNTYTLCDKKVPAKHIYSESVSVDSAADRIADAPPSPPQFEMFEDGSPVFYDDNFSYDDNSIYEEIDQI